jgi:hypothetical protein
VKKAKPENDEEAEKQFFYTIYGGGTDPELVRKHLDSGVLEKLIEEKLAKLLAKPEKFELRDPCYVYVLLGACAMTLGCQLPDSYIAMLKKVYTEGGLMPDALKQMNKALFGPDGFKNGVPYDFKSKGLIETFNSLDKSRKSSPAGFIGLNVIGPGGLINTGMGDSKSSEIIKELRDKHHNPDTCGGCGAKQMANGDALLQCSKCHDRKYCGIVCQKRAWKVHKKVCEPANQ